MKKNPSSKRKLPNTWQLKDTIMAILAFISVVVMIWGNCCYVKASTVPSVEYPLPFIVENENVTGFSSFIDILARCNSSYAYYANRYNNGDTCFGYDYYEGGRQKFRLIFPESNFTYSFSLSTNYESFDFTQNRAEMTISGFSYISGYCESYNGRNYFYGEERQNYPNTMILSFFNGTSKGNGSMLVPNISTQNYIYNDDEYKVVFGFGNPTPPSPEFNTGHATEPTFDPDNNINTDGHAHQPNDPQFPQFPTIVIDTTNVESLLESIFDAVTALGDYVGQCFSTFFAWVVSVIKNAIQAVINTINNLVEFLHDNFVSLFEPMAENVGYAVEPVQENEIVQAFEDTGIYADFSSMTDLVNDSFDVFEDIDEPNTFRIPIHLENVTMLNCTTQYIDLGWFDSCKTALRAFMWCVTTFGLLYTIIDALPSYISGGDE